MKIVISPMKTARLLFLTVLFIICMGIAWKEVIERYWPTSNALVLLQPFNTIDNDASIAAWYSSFALLFCSVLLAAIAVSKKRCDDQYAFHWRMLSFIFLLLAIDEVARIHETVGYFAGNISDSMGFTPQGYVYYFWVVPGVIFVLIFLLAFLRFLFHLPKKTRRLFLCSGAFFVAGALGIEILESQRAYLTAYGLEGGITNPKVLYSQPHVEEAVEMLSIVVFIYALLLYMDSYVKKVTIEIGTKGK